MSAAIHHILRQMQRDARLAWLIGPGSRTYELLTEEAATTNGLDVEELRQQHEASLKFEPWPSALPVEVDTQTVMLTPPDRQPTHWHGSGNRYSSNGHILERRIGGRYANLWEGFETRKAVHGNEAWTSAYRYYVPNDFGHLVEVPAP